METLFVDRYSRSNSRLRFDDTRQITDFAKEAMNATGNYNFYYLTLTQLAAKTRKNEALHAYLELARSVMLGNSLHFEQAEGLSESAVSGPIEEFAGKIGAASLVQLIGKINKRQALTEKLGLKYFPRIHALFASIEKACDAYLMRGIPCKEIIRPGGVIMTAGSCFAQNIGAFLSAALDCSRVHFGPGEEADSGYFLKFSREFAQKRPADAQRIAEAERPVLFYTIGISEVLVDEQGGTHSVGVLKENPAFARRKSSTIQAPETIAAQVEEAIGNFRRINPALEVVVTVSPVPLEATFQKNASIVSADCLSKSTLRYAVSLLCDPDKAIHYFPSFELVKWLCPLMGLPPYGEDDGHPRHVSNRVVAAICLLFAKYFGSPEVFERCVRNVCAIDDVRNANLPDSLREIQA